MLRRPGHGTATEVLNLSHMPGISLQNAHCSETSISSAEKSKSDGYAQHNFFCDVVATGDGCPFIYSTRLLSTSWDVDGINTSTESPRHTQTLIKRGSSQHSSGKNDNLEGRNHSLSTNACTQTSQTACHNTTDRISSLLSNRHLPPFSLCSVPCHK
jgi:hypothetical protein